MANTCQRVLKNGNLQSPFVFFYHRRNFHWDSTILETGVAPHRPQWLASSWSHPQQSDNDDSCSKVNDDVVIAYLLQTTTTECFEENGLPGRQRIDGRIDGTTMTPGRQKTTRGRSLRSRSHSRSCSRLSRWRRLFWPIGRYFGYKPSWIGIEKRSEAPSSFFFSYTHSIRLFGQPPPPLQRGCWNKICVTDIFWLNICKYSYIIYEYTGWIAYTCIQMYRYIILSRQ